MVPVTRGAGKHPCPLFTRRFRCHYTGLDQNTRARKLIPLREMAANRNPESRLPSDAGTVLLLVASLRGGAAAHALTLAQGLRSLGWRTVFVAPNDAPARAGRVHSLCDAWEQFPLHLFPGIEQLRGIEQLVASHAPDVLHAHGIRAGCITRAWAVSRRVPGLGKGSRPPLLYTVHGLHPEFSPNSFRRWAGLAAEKALNRTAARVIVVSPSDRDLILARKLAPQDRVVLIPNAIDPAPFRIANSRDQARSALGIPEGAFVVGTLARLHPQKAVHVLIDAAQRLHRKINHLLVLIAGDGPLRAELETRCKAPELLTTVRFLGEVSDPARFYRALDVFCLTSLWEGCPLVLLEAAAVDVPIVATGVPGTKDLIRHERNGLVVPPKDPDALAEALIRYQRDPAYAWKLASEATRSLEPHFHPETMCRAVADLYASVRN